MVFNLLGLSTIQKCALVILGVLSVASSVALYIYVKGKESAEADINIERVKVLENEIKKNAKAKSISESVSNSDDAHVIEWLQSNDFYRED